MKIHIAALTLLVAGMLPVGPAQAAEANNPPPLCGPTTAGSQSECGADKYVSFVKAFNECGFEKSCSPVRMFAMYPSLECNYQGGEVICDAWPQTWPGTGEPITYLWSKSGSIALPSGYGEHSPSVAYTCLAPQGGTVVLRMRAPGGSNWVEMTVSVRCRGQTSTGTQQPQ